MYIHVYLSVSCTCIYMEIHLYGTLAYIKVGKQRQLTQTNNTDKAMNIHVHVHAHVH